MLFSATTKKNGKKQSGNPRLHASTSITLRAYRVLAGSSHHAYHFKNPTFSRKVQVTLPLSSCHMLKRPKDIESDIFSGGLAYLFRARDIQMTHCNGQWKMRDSS